MTKLMNVVGAFAFAGMLAGCASTTMRESVQKEYDRITALPPAERIFSPNKQVDDVGRLSCDLYNFCHPLLMEYVAATENHREYTGFMNDVQCVIKEEGLSEEEAMAKVYNLIQEEDMTRPEEEKVWPRVLEGWAAAEALEPEKKLAQIAVLAVRNLEIVDSANNLSASIANEDYMSQIQRGAEVGMITAQTAQTAEMLAFLGEQYRRVLNAKYYRK